MTAQNLPLLERLMLHVEPKPNTGCWLWTAAVDKKGYGRVGAGRGPSGEHETKFAHRVMYALRYGPIAAEQCVLHHCDNPPCVNPDHLYLGDRLQNGRDMAARWRGRRSASGLPYGVKRFNHSRANPFKASVNLGGREYYLGLYPTAEDASAVSVAFKEKFLREGAPK